VNAGIFTGLHYYRRKNRAKSSPKVDIFPKEIINKIINKNCRTDFCLLPFTPELPFALRHFTFCASPFAIAKRLQQKATKGNKKMQKIYLSDIILKYNAK